MNAPCTPSRSPPPFCLRTSGAACRARASRQRGGGSQRAAPPQQPCFFPAFAAAGRVGLRLFHRRRHGDVLLLPLLVGVGRLHPGKFLRPSGDRALLLAELLLRLTPRSLLSLFCALLCFLPQAFLALCRPLDRAQLVLRDRCCGLRCGGRTLRWCRRREASDETCGRRRAFCALYFLRRCHVSTAEPTSCAAARRFDSAILAVSSGTTTAGSIVARSSSGAAPA